MKLTNGQLLNYKERIKFGKEEKAEYQDQIDRMIGLIEAAILEHIDTRVIKVRQAGSWRKGTIIKPQHDVPVDIDLIFYLDIDHDEYSDLHHANDKMMPILKSVYPQKNDEDFWDNPRTAGLEFIESGLHVDIVPVGKTNNPDYVAQPDIDGNVYYTSPTKQLEFIKQRKEANPNYTAIVRLIKKWRNFQDIKLSSFAIELIVAHLDITAGVEIDISEAILRFFKLIGKKKFPVILFNAPFGTYEDEGSHVYIADPTHSSNNVVRSMTDSDWGLVRECANTAFDTLVLAEEEPHQTATLDLWKELFGPDFNTNPIE